MDPTVHPVTAQAVSGQEQRGWKASAVRMERRIPDASPCPDWDLVCARPDLTDRRVQGDRLRIITHINDSAENYET